MSLLLALAACAPEPMPTATAIPTTSKTATTTPSPQPTPTAATGLGPAVPNALSCDNMLDPAVDAELRAEGLLPAPKPFTQFNFTVAGPALECPWGGPDDVHSEAYYVWAAFAPGDRDAFMAVTAEHDYLAEESAEGTWVVYAGDAGPDDPAILVTEEWIAMAPSREKIGDILLTR